MDQKAKKSSSFLSQFFIIQLHKKASKKIEDFGKEKLLIPKINKLVSNIEVENPLPSVRTMARLCLQVA